MFLIAEAKIFNNVAVVLLLKTTMFSAGFSMIYVIWQTVCYCFSTASGLHHQLIVTQESVCLHVLLQSPAILSTAVLLVAWRRSHLSQIGQGAEGAVVDPGA